MKEEEQKTQKEINIRNKTKAEVYGNLVSDQVDKKVIHETEGEIRVKLRYEYSEVNKEVLLHIEDLKGYKVEKTEIKKGYKYKESTEDLSRKVLSKVYPKIRKEIKEKRVKEIEEEDWKYVEKGLVLKTKELSYKISEDYVLLRLYKYKIVGERKEEKKENLKNMLRGLEVDILGEMTYETLKTNYKEEYEDEEVYKVPEGVRGIDTGEKRIELREKKRRLEVSKQMQGSTKKVIETIKTSIDLAGHHGITLVLDKLEISEGGLKGILSTKSVERVLLELGELRIDGKELESYPKLSGGYLISEVEDEKSKKVGTNARVYVKKLSYESDYHKYKRTPLVLKYLEVEENRAILSILETYRGKEPVEDILKDLLKDHLKKKGKSEEEIETITRELSEQGYEGRERRTLLVSVKGALYTIVSEK